MGLSYKDWFSADGEYGYFHGDTLRECPSHKLPLVQNILYEKDVVCLSSGPGVGKSMLALQLLCNLTTGRPFLDTYAVFQPMNVLYVQTEGDRSETLERLELMEQGIGIDDKRWAHINVPGLMLNDRDEFNKFLALIQSHPLKYDVIIIDPLYTTVVGSLNADDVATAWVRHVRELRGLYNCAIWVNHHDAKDVYYEGMVIDKGNRVSYGSVFWQAFFNQNFKLRVKKGIYSFELGKDRSDKIIDKIELKLVDEPLMFVSITDDTDSNSLIVRGLIEKLRIPTAAKALIKLTGISKSTMYRILAKLVKHEQIKEIYTTSASLYIPTDMEVPNGKLSGGVDQPSQNGSQETRALASDHTT